jgi:hypothetical protein
VDRQSAPLLTLGKRKWTRYELVSKVGVGNFKAVMILIDALQKLGVKDIESVKKLSVMAIASIKGVGPTTLFVLMSLLQNEGTDVQEWYTDTRTFQSVKKEQERVKADTKREQKAAQRRRRTIEKPRRRYGLRELPGQQALPH